jgi:hypothetical protein
MGSAAVTLNERHIETGLDFLEARYYSSVQGRFTTVDPIFFPKEMLIDPQHYIITPTLGTIR